MNRPPGPHVKRTAPVLQWSRVIFAASIVTVAASAYLETAGLLEPISNGEAPIERAAHVWPLAFLALAAVAYVLSIWLRPVIPWTQASPLRIVASAALTLLLVVVAGYASFLFYFMTTFVG